MIANASSISWDEHGPNRILNSGAYLLKNMPADSVGVAPRFCCGRNSADLKVGTGTHILT